MTADTTRHDNQERDSRNVTEHDIGTVIVSVADAAAILGISAGAVRKRIERGQLAGHKVAGQWHVILNATDTSGHDTTSTTRPVAPDHDDTTRHDTTETSVSRVDIRLIQTQLEERYIATIERLQAAHREEIDRLQAAYAETIAAKDGDLVTAGRLIDELRRRAEHAEREREELRQPAGTPDPSMSPVDIEALRQRVIRVEMERDQLLQKVEAAEAEVLAQIAYNDQVGAEHDEHREQRDDGEDIRSRRWWRFWERR